MHRHNLEREDDSYIIPHHRYCQSVHQIVDEDEESIEPKIKLLHELCHFNLQLHVEILCIFLVTGNNNFLSSTLPILFIVSNGKKCFILLHPMSLHSAIMI